MNSRGYAFITKPAVTGYTELIQDGCLFTARGLFIPETHCLPVFLRGSRTHGQPSFRNSTLGNIELWVNDPFCTPPWVTFNMRQFEDIISLDMITTIELAFIVLSSIHHAVYIQYFSVTKKGQERRWRKNERFQLDCSILNILCLVGISGCRGICPGDMLSVGEMGLAAELQRNIFYGVE